MRKPWMLPELCGLLQIVDVVLQALGPDRLHVHSRVRKTAAEFTDQFSSIYIIGNVIKSHTLTPPPSALCQAQAQVQVQLRQSIWETLLLKES